MDHRAARQASYQTSSFSRFGGTTLVNEDGDVSNQDEEDAYGYVVALVDLKAGTMLWYKRSTGNRGNPRLPETFYQSWAVQALKPFYPR